MSGFHEVLFPPKIAYGASGGLGFHTTITTTLSGFEQRNVDWHKARGRWDIGTGLKSRSHMEILQAFFYARYGKAYGFCFKDWSDYQALDQTLGIGNGLETSFQLVKHYTSGAYTYLREIKKPVESTIKVYLNSLRQKSGFTVDRATGLVRFSKPPEKEVIISVDFEFDVPVRFDTDTLAVRAEGPGIFVWDAIPLVEIRL